MGGRDIIDLVEFDPGCKLAVIISLSAPDPVNGNRCIGDLRCVFILNGYCEIGTFKERVKVYSSLLFETTMVRFEGIYPLFLTSTG